MADAVHASPFWQRAPPQFISLTKASLPLTKDDGVGLGQRLAYKGTAITMLISQRMAINFSNRYEPDSKGPS